MICPVLNDKFTVNKSNGNGALTYPVGLITADEVAMAGNVIGSTNVNSYLYTNQYYWLGTPYKFQTSSSASVSIFYMTCRISSYTVDFSAGVRPVINLSANAKLSGDGTYNNVYTVS